MSDTTTTNIPTTDPALLAAQARAGQAGVDAYNAAINTLQQQRATAVNSAMTATAARGIAEPGAGGDVGRMYDARLSQLQSGLGQFQANTAARGQRLADYNAAVGSARSLIPGQVSMITAPIKAQGEYDVWKIGAQGREAVDKIDAQRRLIESQIAAAQAAAARAGGGGRGGRGGGSGPKVTGANAAAVIKDAANQLSAAYAAPAAQAAQTAPTQQAAQAGTAAANYTGKSLQAEQFPVGSPAWLALHPGQTGAEAGAGRDINLPTSRTGAPPQGQTGFLSKLLSAFTAPLQQTAAALQAAQPGARRTDLNTYYRTGQMPGGGAESNLQSNLSAVQRALGVLGGIRGPIARPGSFPTTGGGVYRPAAAPVSPGAAQQGALTALQQSLGVGSNFQFPSIVAPAGTPWAGHEVGTLESIMAPLGVAPGATSGTMQFPEQQAAAQAALEEARSIGTSAYQAAGQQGADLLRSSGAYNIPEADVTSSLAKLGGTTYDDIAREQQGLDKSLSPQATIDKILKDRTAAVNADYTTGQRIATSQAEQKKLDEQQKIDTAQASLNTRYPGVNVVDLAKSAGMGGQYDTVLNIMGDARFTDYADKFQKALATPGVNLNTTQWLNKNVPNQQARALLKALYG